LTGHEGERFAVAVPDGTAPGDYQLMPHQEDITLCDTPGQHNVALPDSLYGYRYTIAWDGVLIACAVGITLYVLVLILERLLIPWHTSLQND